jgi:hypothetical protein
MVKSRATNRLPRLRSHLRNAPNPITTGIVRIAMRLALTVFLVHLPHGHTADAGGVEATDAGFRFRVQRLPDNPIIHGGLPGLEGEIGRNINGPSLVRAPDWLPNRLGNYYLYFAHHHGRFIRLAYADQLAGPWTIHPGGVLPLEQTPGYEGRSGNHVASPDVHLDHAARQIRMYFHQPTPTDRPRGQGSYLAFSRDGLQFLPRSEYLGLFYFRGFQHGGWHYALAKYHNDGGILYRSRDGISNFETGPRVLPRVRHTALWLHDSQLYVFYSRGGDTPEHILVSRVSNLDADWHGWVFSEPIPVLKPEYHWEGVDQPIEPSRFGAIYEPVHQLRDPAIFEEDDRLFLLYSTAGEQAIAIAELFFERLPTSRNSSRDDL